MKTESTTATLNHRSTWSYTHEGIYVEIINWGTMNHGKGTWNYYLYIHEHKFPFQLSHLWIEPTYERWTPESPLRKNFDYLSSPLADIPIHGGITFYDQLNSDIPGSRAIQFGCDYNHLRDEELGHRETLTSVFKDSLQSCKDLHTYLINLSSNLN